MNLIKDLNKKHPSTKFDYKVSKNHTVFLDTETASKKWLRNSFVRPGYHSSVINRHLERISLLNKIGLITEKDTRQKSDRIRLVITYYRFLPKTTETIKKNWNILQINENFKEIFKNEPISAFKWNINIQ